MEHKFGIDRLLGYGAKILGRIVRVKQDAEGIVLPQKIFDQMVSALSTSPLETTVFLFGKSKNKKLLVTDILVPSEKDYKKRTFGHVHVSKKYVINEFPKLLQKEKTLLATVHSHPLDRLSPGDMMTHFSVTRHYPNQLSGIFNKRRIFFYRFENGFKETPYTLLDLERFDRQIKMFGEEGQLLISTSTIALIGVGGGNTKIAFDLVSMGVGKLILVDPDEWEESNRNRVFLPPQKVGVPKAKSVKDLIEKYYSNVQVESNVAKAQDISDDIYSKADIIVVGPDSLTARIFGNRLALRLKKPAVFPAAGIDVEDERLTVMGGSVQVVIPGNSPCYECATKISSLEIMKENMDPEMKRKLTEKYSLGALLDVQTAPAVVCLNDVISGAAIWEILKLITGIEKPIDFQVYDALKGQLVPVKIEKKPSCPACGEAAEASEDFEPFSRLEDAPIPVADQTSRG